MMRKRLLVLATAATLAGTTLLAAPAAQAEGTTSLASVLTAQSGFDKNWKNYNIVTAAVLAVLENKPDSAVKLLTDGTAALTAFIPNDDAFRLHVLRTTKKNLKTEEKVFAAVAKLGIPTVEKILLYHVVPGTAILSEAALKANGATLTTGLGQTIKVSVKGTSIFLRDADKVPYPKVILSQVDINKGNAQVAHGINLVLLPKL